MTQSQANRHVSDSLTPMNRPAGTVAGTEPRASTRAENENSLGKGSLVARGKHLNIHVAKAANQDGAKQPVAKRPKMTSKKTGIPLKKVLENCSSRTGDLSDVFKTMAADSKDQKKKDAEERVIRRKEVSEYRSGRMKILEERNAAKAIREAEKLAIDRKKVGLDEKRLKLEANSNRRAGILDELKMLYGVSINPNSNPTVIERAMTRIDELGKVIDLMNDDFD